MGNDSIADCSPRRSRRSAKPGGFRIADWMAGRRHGLHRRDAESAEDSRALGGTANGKAFNAAGHGRGRSPARENAETAEKDRNRVKADGVPKRDAPRGR